jgi:hypothetical protein
MHARSPRITRALVTVLVGVVAVLATGAGSIGSASAAAKPEPIRRTIWAQGDPGNAPGQTLYLQQVVIDPGAKLPEHFHEGTQIATVRAGVLTYNVISGTAFLTRADGTKESAVGPTSVKLRRGDALTEPESMVHYGANRGRVPVVLEIAALLGTGAPLSTPVGDRTGTPLHVDTVLTSDSRSLNTAGADGSKTYGWNRLVGTSTLNGQSVSVDMQASVQYTAGNGPFFGFVTFTFADGSTLGVSMQGQTAAKPDSADASFTSTLGVIGGTGTYAKATGSGMFTGTRQAQLGGQVSATFDLDLGGLQ